MGERSCFGLMGVILQLSTVRSDPGVQRLELILNTMGYGPKINKITNK